MKKVRFLNRPNRSWPQRRLEDLDDVLSADISDDWLDNIEERMGWPMFYWVAESKEELKKSERKIITHNSIVHLVRVVMIFFIVMIFLGIVYLILIRFF
ncbi:MAG: hypothetical protein WC817_00355 [Patescibacteria group bacterium]|jgi:hypothetical protein